MSEKTREDIIRSIALALSEIYFAEVVDPKPTSEDLLNSAARMRAIHEAVNTAKDLLGILDKATGIGSEQDECTGVIILPALAPDGSE